uniref:DUF1758 domain-containing protein n=1 Tax=Wuchereria bancrofti TaxID=6293 RepID=A0AAF5Q6M1_WUCBA
MNSNPLKEVKENGLELLKIYKDKPEQIQQYNPRGTSALSTVKGNQNFAKTITKKRRPCVFCARDHWDSDCEIYITLNDRLNRLKVLKKCTVCLRDSHKGEICKVKKQCFYCGAPHNSALCDKRNSLPLNNIMYQRNEEQEKITPSKEREYSTSLYNSIQRNKRNFTFMNRNRVHCSHTINVLTTGNEIISLQANITDYLTNELQVVETSSCGDINKLCKTNFYPKEIVYSANANINSELEKFWKLETIDIQESPQADDNQALKHFKRTITKQGGRYQNLINRLEHNSILHLYHKILIDQLHSGIIEEVHSKDEVGVIHYLPYHEVLTPSKTTIKLIIVYDASAHEKGFKSLNEVLYRGPVMLPDLVGVILRFQMMKIVITADIEKAFLQLELQNEERNCTRFLWLNDIDKELSDGNIKC